MNRFWCKLAKVVHGARTWNGQLWRSDGQRSRSHEVRYRLEPVGGMILDLLDRVAFLVCDLTTYRLLQSRKIYPTFKSNWLHIPNKCIGDDTKAAALQSLNCIKNKNKIKYGEKRFSILRMEFLHPAMWHVALESWQWIHQVAAPCNVIRGLAMTCHWIRPNVRHIAILHLVSISTTSPPSACHAAPVSEILSDHRRPVICYCRKNDVMSIFKMADLSHLGF